MSKTTSNNVNTTKNKRETPKISTRADSTTRRTGAAKISTTSQPSSTKKSTLAKTSDEKDKIRNPALIKNRTNENLKLKTPAGKSTIATTPRTVNSVRKQQEVKQNVAQSRTTTSKPPTSTTNPKQPLRAKHTIEIKRAIERNKPTSTVGKTVKPNAVLNTPHNVTVASPPAKRKTEAIHTEQKTEEKEQTLENVQESKLKRKGSRVLAPEEIVVLKRESAKKRSEEKILRDHFGEQQQLDQLNSLSSLPDPVAFEVKFDENATKTKEKRERSRSRVKEKAEVKTVEDETNYSDDTFDSYDSDFENDLTSQESSKQSEEETEQDSEDSAEEEEEQEEEDEEEPDEESSNESAEEISDEEDKDHFNKNKSKLGSDTEDESQLLQDPITVMQPEKERKLDSGHYEMNSRRYPKLSETTNSSVSAQSTQMLPDSLDAFCLNNSDQLDSGISAYGPMTNNNFNQLPLGNYQVFYGGYKEFTNRPIFNKRGKDLLSKIKFDSLGFTLLEMKPISYDLYMQTFGRLNTGQVATQTQDDLMHVEQQTEPYETRCMWTQHPAQYDLQMVEKLYEDGAFKGLVTQNCCGEVTEEGNTNLGSDEDLAKSLEALKQLENQRSNRNLLNHVQSQRKPINYENLNSFLLRSSMVINQILGSSQTKRKNSLGSNKEMGALSIIMESSYQLDTNFLNTLKVVKIFSNPRHNIFITVHESLPETDVYKSDFSQLLMVWCINSPDKPLRLLTTWSKVSKLEISYDSPDIIVAALRDGSVSLWDLRETHSFCSKLDGYLTHFAATQSIVPFWAGLKGKTDMLMDLGACLDVRSFRSPTNKWGALNSVNTNGSKSQFVSLHDSGIVTVWSLVESLEASDLNFLQNSSKNSSKLKYSTKLQQKFSYSSPWARVKLIQSSIVQLKDYVDTKPPAKTQSHFDKTKNLFQKNIYSDELLKELHDETDTKVGQQGLRFTSLECGSETIYICTNRNFIMMCSKTLKTERFRRITLNESRLLFPTALKVLSNENFLAVGLSNGAVMILNCSLNKLQKIQKPTEKCKTPATPFPGQTQQNSNFDIDPMSGKSCAIQNIVLNSQKSYNSMDYTMTDQQDDFRPNTAAFIALIDSQQKPFELRVYDQQIILSGSVLRRNLIQSLDLSADGWRLFALSNNRIRIYDFYMDQEIVEGNKGEISECGNVLDIGCTKVNTQELNLITLEKNSKVTVFNLKK